MNTRLQKLIERNRKLLIIIGITVIIGGIALAYFAGDAEPWGTIGGILSAIGLFLSLMPGFSKKESTN